MCTNQVHIIQTIAVIVFYSYLRCVINRPIQIMFPAHPYGFVCDCNSLIFWFRTLQDAYLFSLQLNCGLPIPVSVENFNFNRHKRFCEKKMGSYVLYVLSFYHRISNTFALFLQPFFNVPLLHILTVTVHTCMIYLEKAVFV